MLVCVLVRLLTYVVAHHAYCIPAVSLLASCMFAGLHCIALPTALHTYMALDPDLGDRASAANDSLMIRFTRSAILISTVYIEDGQVYARY